MSSFDRIWQSSFDLMATLSCESVTNLLRICSIQPSCLGFAKGFSQQQAREFVHRGSSGRFLYLSDRKAISNSVLHDASDILDSVDSRRRSQPSFQVALRLLTPTRQARPASQHTFRDRTRDRLAEQQATRAAGAGRESGRRPLDLVLNRAAGMAAPAAQAAPATVVNAVNHIAYNPPCFVPPATLPRCRHPLRFATTALPPSTNMLIFNLHVLYLFSLRCSSPPRSLSTN